MAEAFDLLAQAGPLCIAPQYLAYMVDVLQGRRAPYALRASVVAGRRLVGAEVVDGIALVPVTGPIMHRADAFQAFGATSVNDLRATIGAALDDPGVDGVLLVGDSPGGEVAGVADLADDLFAARGRKPMMAVADEGIFSAAYWLASAVGPVVLPRTGSVGSIGALIVHTDISNMLTQAGVSVTVIKSGARKALFSAFAPLSDDAKAALQSEVNRVADLFITATARYRGLAPLAVAGFEGGTFEGDAAVTAGLADDVLTVDQAFTQFRAHTPRRSRGEGATSMGLFDKTPPAGTSAADVVQTVQTMTAAANAPAPTSLVDMELARKTARDEGRTAALAEAAEITKWCAFAGKPDLAEGFISAGATIEQVRNQLLATTASAGFDAIDTRRPVVSRQYLSIESIYDMRRKAIAEAKRQRIA